MCTLNWVIIYVSGLSKYRLCVGAARIGWLDQKSVAVTIAEMANVDMGLM